MGFFLTTLLFLLWLALCQCRLIRLRRTAQPVTDGPASALLASLTPHPPLLLTHPSVHSPFLAGTRRPAIFLPPAFAADFDPDALRAVFLHELAHRDRRDNLWTLAARLLTAVLWFQPLLWLLDRKMEQSSEDACDQAVLAAHCPPRAYAACLLSLAERPPLARSQRTLTAGVAPFRSSVGRRISRILTQGVPIMPAVTLRLRLSIAALTLAAALGGAFLVSSAPAQTQPKPAPAVTPEMLKFHAEEEQDLSNLKVMSLALVMYERDNHYRFPNADKWMDEITPYLEQIASYRRDRSVFYNPFQPGQKRYGYAFNRNCSQQPLSALPTPASTAIVYESTLGTRNASDTGQSPFVHSVARPGITPWTGSGYGFADGHTKWLQPNRGPYGDAPVSFALNGGETAGSEPPANPSIVGTWLCSHDDGTGNVLIFSPNGTIEEVGPWPGSSTAVDHSYGPNSVVGHSYGRYRTAGPNLMYTFTRVWVEGEKPWTGSNPEKHRQTYSISGNTLILRWSGYKSVSQRVPAYTKAMLGLKPSTSAVISLPNAQLNQAQFLAGLTPVQGPGVVVTLRDSKTPFSYPKGGWPAGIVPPNIIHDSDINQVVNELKAAGVEAITVNNQRLVATSAVRSAGPALLINNTPQEPPYVIKAIGDPKMLAGALNIPGGEADQLKQYDKTMFTVQQAQTLTLPAYAGGNEPRYAKPVGAVGSIILMADRPHISLHRKQVLSALQAERSQLQAQQDERNVIINELNLQMKTQHQALIRQSKQAMLPNRPAMTASEIHALIQSLQKEGKAKHLAAGAAAAQAEVQKTANLPPDNPARIAAQEKFAPILAKLQFLTDVRNYTRKWTALYTTEADTEAKGRRRMAGLQQQQRFSQAQITELDIRIARAERYANR